MAPRFVYPRSSNQHRAIIDVPEEDGVMVGGKLVLAGLKSAGGDDRTPHPVSGMGAVLQSARLYIGTTVVSELRQAGQYLTMIAASKTNSQMASRSAAGDASSYSGVTVSDVDVPESADYRTFGMDSPGNITGDRDTTPETAIPLGHLFGVLSRDMGSGTIPLSRGKVSIVLEFDPNWATSSLNSSGGDWSGTISEPYLMLEVVPAQESDEAISLTWREPTYAGNSLAAGVDAQEQSVSLHLGYGGMQVFGVRVALSQTFAHLDDFIGTRGSVMGIDPTVNWRLNGRLWYPSAVEDTLRISSEFGQANGGNNPSLTSLGIDAEVGDVVAASMIETDNDLEGMISRRGYIGVDFGFAPKQVDESGIVMNYTRLCGGAGIYQQAKDVHAWADVRRTIGISKPDERGRSVVIAV